MRRDLLKEQKKEANRIRINSKNELRALVEIENKVIDIHSKGNLVYVDFEEDYSQVKLKEISIIPEDINKANLNLSRSIENT